ncbi:Unknown protein, partial [Striga hermonthica]
TEASEDEADQHVCVDPVHLLAMEKCAQASEALQKLQNEVFRLSRANRDLNKQASASTATKECELDTAKARTCILESSVKLAKQDELEKAQTIECLRSELFSTQKLLAERNQEIVLLKNEADRLMNERASMESKLKASFAELNRTVKVVRELNKGKAYLNELLSLGKQHGDLIGIGYTGKEDHPESSTGTSSTQHAGLGFGEKLGIGGVNLHGRPSRNVFDRFVKSTISKPLSPKSPLKVDSPMQKSVNKTHHNFVPICHYCGVTGHIRPKCYRMQHDLCTGNFKGWNQSGIPVKVHARTLPNNRAKTHQVWVAKKSLNCFDFVVSLRTSLKGKWYLDSGCSRHMTGEPSYLMNIQSSSNRQ